jgi:hypothetical protein
MYLNHKTLYHMAKVRMEEDQRAAEYERFIHPFEIRLNLLTWRIRVREVLENIEAVRESLERKEASLPDST